MGEAIGVVEIRVIAEMIVQNVEMIHAIAEMIRVIVGMILEMIVDSIVDLLVEMIGTVVVVIVLNAGMIAVVIVLIVEMIAVVIARLIIGDPDHELCLHPRMIVVIVHQEMVHQEMAHRGMVHQSNDPEVIKNRKMTVGVQLLSVNKCLI